MVAPQHLRGTALDRARRQRSLRRTGSGGSTKPATWSLPPARSSAATGPARDPGPGGSSGGPISGQTRQESAGCGGTPRRAPTRRRRRTRRPRRCRPRARCASPAAALSTSPRTRSRHRRRRRRAGAARDRRRSPSDRARGTTPRRSAKARRSAIGSEAAIQPAPWKRASSALSRPNAPRPKIATRSPSLSEASCTACWAIVAVWRNVDALGIEPGPGATNGSPAAVSTAKKCLFRVRPRQVHELRPRACRSPRRRPRRSARPTRSRGAVGSRALRRPGRRAGVPGRSACRRMATCRATAAAPCPG